jgi:hypothetical protein
VVAAQCGAGGVVSASVTSAGLAVFLIMSEPKGGHPQATAQAWFPALLVFGCLTGLLTILAGGGSPVRRAAFYATSAGIVWALLATFMKSTADVLGEHGVLATLQQGAIYGLIVAGITGTVLTQAALHYGPLAVSQPLMVIVDPFVSVILGVWLYGQHFVGGSLEITMGVLGFGVMVVGVIFLARTAPSFEAELSAPSPSTA